MVSANASGHRPLVRHQGAICDQWSLVLVVKGPACLLKTSALDGLLVLVTDCGRMAEPRLHQIQVHGMELNTCIWEDVSELSRNFPPSPAGLTTPSATRSTGQLEDTQVGGGSQSSRQGCGLHPCQCAGGGCQAGLQLCLCTNSLTPDSGGGCPSPPGSPALLFPPRPPSPSLRGVSE